MLTILGRAGLRLSLLIPLESVLQQVASLPVKIVLWSSSFCFLKALQEAVQGRATAERLHPALPSLLLLCSDTEHSAHLGARKNSQGNNDDGILTEKKKFIWRSLALCGRSHKTGSDLQAVNCVSLGTVALLPGNLPGRS